MNEEEFNNIEKPISKIKGKDAELAKMFSDSEDKNEKQEKHNYIDTWEPEWVRLKMLGATYTSHVEKDGMLFATTQKSPDGYVDVPENLADDVATGKIDPFQYTREELRQMSIERHRRETITEMVSETYANDGTNENKSK